MADECRGSGAGSLLLAFVMGAAIGGGLALLAAPRSGRETRDKIRGLADEVQERVKDYTTQAEDRVKATLEEGRELLKEQADLIKAAVEAGKEAMEEERAKHKKTA